MHEFASERILNSERKAPFTNLKNFLQLIKVLMSLNLLRRSKGIRPTQIWASEIDSYTNVGFMDSSVNCPAYAILKTLQVQVLAFDAKNTT